MASLPPPPADGSGPVPVDSVRGRYLVETFATSRLADALRFRLVPAPDTPIQVTPVPDVSIPGVASGPNEANGFLSLPRDIVALVFDTMDLQSMASFSAVSRRAHQLTEAYAPYSKVLAYAPAMVRALVGCGLGTRFTPRHLFSMLRQIVCASCWGNLAFYLHLPSGTRVCYSCLATNPGLQVLPVNLMHNIFSLPHAMLAVTSNLSAYALQRQLPAQHAYGRPGELRVCVHHAAMRHIFQHGRPVWNDRVYDVYRHHFGAWRQAVADAMAEEAEEAATLCAALDPVPLSTRTPQEFADIVQTAVQAQADMAAVANGDGIRRMGGMDEQFMTPAVLQEVFDARPFQRQQTDIALWGGGPEGPGGVAMPYIDRYQSRIAGHDMVTPGHWCLGCVTIVPQDRSTAGITEVHIAALQLTREPMTTAEFLTHAVQCPGVLAVEAAIQEAALQAPANPGAANPGAANPGAANPGAAV